jgi:IclR family transcriptional regulator, pca regulon regulatory protein
MSEDKGKYAVSDVRRSRAGGLGPVGETEPEGPMEGGRYSQSLRHGLAIMASFDPGRRELGIAELADELGMSRSTAHRYASTLVELGYLEQDSGRRYRLTPRAADLGLAAMRSLELRTCAHPLLAELRIHTGRTVSIGILDGSEVVLLDRLRGWRRGLHEIDLRRGPGSRVPAHCTAIGKVLLAHLPDSRQSRVLKGLTLSRNGPNCITTMPALHDELERVRTEGLAVDEEELIAGLCSIAVPVRDLNGRVGAAVDIAASTGVLSPEDLIETLGDRLILTAKNISAALVMSPSRREAAQQ